MKRTHMMLVLVALVAVCAGSAMATGVDPGIIVGGGRGSIGMTGNTLALSYPGNPGCTSGAHLTSIFGNPVTGPLAGLPFMQCVLLNNSGSPFTNIQFKLTFPQNQSQPYTLQCPAVVCSGFTQAPNGLSATFFFNPPVPNSGPLSEFSVVFVNWAQGTTFGVQANAPEPATLALLGTGLVGIALRLRRKKVKV